MADHPRGDSGSIAIEEHLARILGSLEPLPAVSVPVGEALGRTLAESTVSALDVPGFANSAMDGYAVRRADVLTATPEQPTVLRVIADLPAGTALDPALDPGEAARIMTGAPVPQDADSIVPVEDTDEGLEFVRIHRAPSVSAHIRPAGSDVRAGDAVLTAGRALTARDLAAAAATGLDTLTVHPAVRVGVLSTGSELREPGAELERGQIHDSDSILLAGAITECGGIPVPLGTVSDDPDALHTVLDRHASTVDAFVTSGGVSVGAYDIVKAVLAPLGVWFGSVRMQPGKPQGYGMWPRAASEADIPIFALPGNPVSVFVSFEEFVRPALLTMQGHRDVLRTWHPARVLEGWRGPEGRTQFMPGVVETTPSGDLTVRPASRGGSQSYLVAGLAGANALARVPEGVAVVHEGDLVDVTLVR